MSGIYSFSDKWKYIVKIIVIFSLLLKSSQAIAEANVQISELLTSIPYSQQYAERELVDISNNLASRILVAHSRMRNNRHNLLFSPWELMNVIVALYEATGGKSAMQIAEGVHLPPTYTVRLGYYDVYRKLKMCCANLGIPLTSLEFARSNITVFKQYEYILYQYGFNIQGLSGTVTTKAPDVPSEEPTTPATTRQPTTEPPCEKPAATTTTRQPTTTTTTTRQPTTEPPCEKPAATTTTRQPTTEPPCEKPAATTTTRQPTTTTTTTQQPTTTTTTTQQPTTEPPCEKPAATTTTESPCEEATTTTTTQQPTTTTTTTQQPTTTSTTAKPAKPTNCKCHKKPKRGIPNDNYVQISAQQYVTPTPYSNTFNSQELFNYYSQFGVAVLECNLATPETSLLILLPDNGISGTDAVGSLLQKESLREIRSKLTPTWMKVQIPNFQIREKVSFAQYLKKMGITDIFNRSSAIFHSMTNETDVYVKSIWQANDIVINGVVPNTHLNPNYELPAIHFIADRPFFFFIIHKSLGMAIMAGRVSNLESCI